tara:strand:+ start:3021 stop:3254 length:234 start_codon:yes stop_codon:yes gene_type:complete
LSALEFWLNQLGAEKNPDNPSVWYWFSSAWKAQIILNREELCVIWDKGSTQSQCCFSYGLSREDVETAINEGPIKRS